MDTIRNIKITFDIFEGFTWLNNRVMGRDIKRVNPSPTNAAESPIKGSRAKLVGSVSFEIASAIPLLTLPVDARTAKFRRVFAVLAELIEEM